MIIAPYAAILAILFVYLTYLVIKARGEHKIALGQSVNNETPFDMLRKLRAQGNFSEMVPLALILIALSELSGAEGWAIHLAGSVLVIGRIMHAVSLLKVERYENGVLTGRILFRQLGMICTLAVILATSIFLLVSAS